MAEEVNVERKGPGDLKALAGKYLTFRLGNEDYGLQVLKVQEIIGIMNVTRVPRMPSSVRGIINLRGKLIPIVDMRNKFGMAHQEDSLKTCIIVVQVALSGSRITMGIIVDNVSEVLTIQEREIERPPTFGTNINTEFMLGMGKVGQKVVILLDIDQVMTASEMEQLTSVAAATGTAPTAAQN